MPELDLGRVQAFLAAAEHGNFTQAAAALYITQQALSKRIAALESGGPLFERHPGGVRLTERGRTFLPAAERLVEAYAQARAALEDEPVTPLRIDTWSTIQAPALWLGRFHLEHPDAKLQPSYRKSLPEAIEALQRREIDLAFGNVPHLGRALPDGLEAVHVLDEVIAGLVTRDDPLQEVTLEAARQRGLWFPGEGASEELVNYMRWVGEILDVRVDTTGTNASLAHIHDVMSHLPRPAICMTGRDWPLPSPERFRIIPAPVIPPYAWWLVRRSGFHHPLLGQLRDWFRERVDR